MRAVSRFFYDLGWVAVSYWAISWANWVLFQGAGILPMPIWPAAGLAVALVYHRGGRVVPGLMLGAFLANAITLGSGWQMALIVGLVNGLGPWAALAGARIFSRRREPYGDMHDTIIFIIWAVFIHAALTATVGVGGRLLLGQLSQPDLFMAWLRWWLAHAAGTVLFAPLLLSWFFPREETQARNGEYLVVSAVTVSLTTWMFFFTGHLPLGLPYFLIVPLAWVAIRHAMVRAMLLFTLFVLIAMGGVVLVRPQSLQGPFPLLPFTLMAVAYGLVLLVLSSMKRGGEEVLRALEAKTDELDRYFSASLDLLCIADQSGRFLRLNPEWEKTLGYPVEALLGRQFIDLVHPEDQETTLASLSRLGAQQEVLSFENRYRCQDGSYRWIEWRSHPQGDLIYAAARDVTDRKRIEMALSASERKLSTLFDSMSEMVVLHELVFDESGQVVDYRIIDCNLAYTEVTGVKKEAAVGRLGSDVYGSMPPPYLKEYARVANQGGNSKLETYYAPMDKHFLISLAALGPNQFATITIDITAIKRAEETIARINDQLKSKNKELEQVIYVASHDLRSPLVNIDGYSREMVMGIEQIKGALDAEGDCGQAVRSRLNEPLIEMETALRFVRKSAGQMDALLTGLLKLSRSGRSALHIAPLDMTLLVQSVLEGVEYQLKAAGARVSVETLPPCLGDRLAVSQIFTNLIGNAIKYLDPARPGQIRITGERDDNQVRYVVEDNGIGIARGHQEKIFEVFHRLLPGKYPGEGLGLTIVRQTLDRLGGSIGVESTPDLGSRFTVTLPAVRGGGAL
jgi:PAS domain S-box-containing protein